MASIMNFFSGFAQADTLQLVRTSAVAGVCFHIAIARASVEFEQYMFPCLALAGIINIGGILVPVILGGQNISITIFQTFISWSGFNVGLLTSLLIYRLLLHRCREFPGPLAAKLTRFYAAYLNTKDTQFYQELGKMHEKYGDFVRIGMFWCA